MRPLSQLEMVVASGRSAPERYRLLGRAGCLSWRARRQRHRVQRLLDVWPPDARATAPLVGAAGPGLLRGPTADQSPVEAHIIEALARGGYLTRRAATLDARVPGEWPAALWLRAPWWRWLTCRWRPPLALRG